MDIRDAFFDELYNIAKVDRNVLFLTVDLGSFSLDKFKKDLKNQYINVGVAEQNLVGIASGLTLSGKNVFIYGISSFITSRCFEQIKINLSYMNLPVKIIGSGPGFVYANDGVTHNSTNDIAIIRTLPNMIIYSPCDSVSMTNVARMSYKSENPVYIRVDKGELPQLYSENYTFNDGLSLLKKGKDLLIITTGIMTHQSLKLANKLKDVNIDAGIIDIYKIKPINEKLLLSFINNLKSNKIISLEEHSIIGGLGSIISELLIDNKMSNVKLKRFAISDNYSILHGNREWLHLFYGLDVNNVYNETVKWYNEQ